MQTVPAGFRWPMRELLPSFFNHAQNEIAVELLFQAGNEQVQQKPKRLILNSSNFKM